MARPQRLNADYFSHDANASADEKLVYLESLFGLIGYAVYFKMVEVLTNSDHFETEWNDIKCAIYARKFGVEKSVLNEIIVAATTPQIRLFHLEKGLLWSEGLKKRMAWLLEKRKSESERIAEKRQNKVVDATIEVVDATTPQSKEKETKVSFSTTSSSPAHEAESENFENLEAEKPTPPIAPPPPPVEVRFDLEVGLKDLRENHAHRTAFSMARKIPPDRYAPYLVAFEAEIRSRGKTYPNLPEFREHWLNYAGIRWKIEQDDGKKPKPQGRQPNTQNVENEGDKRITNAFSAYVAHRGSG